MESQSRARLSHWHCYYMCSDCSSDQLFPILNPPPTSLPKPSLWVIPVDQPPASCNHTSNLDWQSFMKLASLLKPHEQTSDNFKLLFCSFLTSLSLPRIEKSGALLWIKGM